MPFFDDDQPAAVRRRVSLQNRFGIFEKIERLKKLLLAASLMFFAARTFSQNDYRQQRVDYRIAVTLNDTDNSLTAFESLDYYNNSADTLRFIWFHLWPNAYKNDRTAFSEQLLENGRTDFYFSAENQRGYINRLAFKVDNVIAATEDHPLHQDIIKLLLPSPLPPGGKITIETPFHEVLPYNFSRGGHIGQSYAATQWYPKPAVYDRTGWHEFPYLDQGEFYSEYGSFDVQVTLPENYIVAATGNLQNDDERKMLLAASTAVQAVGRERRDKKDSVLMRFPPSSARMKTLHYLQDNVHDFAWFADKRFEVKSDTLALPSGRVIRLYCFVLPLHRALWANSLSNMKQAILSKCNWVGEYPYNTVSIVDNAAPVPGGMEYPTVALLTAGGSARELESVINHEIGHNWFYAVIGTNERRYPWMDEGVNTYYDKRYAAEYTDTTQRIGGKSKFLQSRLPAYPEKNILETIITMKKDQPINTASADFSEINYNPVAYEKAAEWLRKLETELGRPLFDSVMHTYYERWKFRHPYPADFKAVAEEVSNRSLTAVFGDLDRKGFLQSPQKKHLKPAAFFSLKETGKYEYISAAPAIGINSYDKLMIGGLLHNYNLPPSAVQFVLAPLYATGTRSFNGIGRVEYNRYPGERGAKITASASAEKFTADCFTNFIGEKHPLTFTKLVPSLKYVFAPKYPRSKIKKYVQWKTYLFSEDALLFSHDTVTNADNIKYFAQRRYLNQFSVGISNSRALYPYDGVFQAEQADGFLRLSFTGNYFFNYASSGGLNLRVFAGKFFYTAEDNFINQYKTDRFHLDLSGPNGYEDYTYSNYFIGRNEFEGTASHQIMARDGFFKVRTDLLSNKIGKTDDWLAAVNLVSDIPKNINPLSVLPFKIPLRVFADIGTYADAFSRTSTTGRFLYDGGLQLSLFHNVVNIYAPLVYSKVYRDYYKSTVTEKKFLNKISFSLDIQRLTLTNLIPKIF